MSLPTTPPRVMRGANGSVAGASGYPPIPAAADNVKYLKGDGTWSALSNASAATDAEASAGTSTTTFVTPANAGIAVAGGRNALAPRGGVAFDGTNSTRVSSTLTGQSIGTDPFSVSLVVRVPKTNPANYPSIFQISSGIGTLASPYSLRAELDTFGLLGFVLDGVSGDATCNVASLPAFVTAWAGKVVHLLFVRNASGNPSLFINGVSQTLTFTTTGTPPTWQGSLASTYLQLGQSTSGREFVGPIYSATLYNLALTQADVTEIYELGGAVPERFKFGSQVNRYASDFSAGVNGWYENAGGQTVITGNIDGISGVDDVLRIARGTTGIVQVRPLFGNFLWGNYLVPSDRPRTIQITLDYYADASCGLGSLHAGSYGQAESNLVTVVEGAWQSNVVFTRASPYANDNISATGVIAVGKNIYLKNVRIKQLGAVCHLRLSDGIGRVLRDSSTNKLHALRTVAGVSDVIELDDGVYPQLALTANGELLDTAGVLRTDAVLVDVVVKNTTANAVTAFGIGMSSGVRNLTYETNIPANSTVILPINRSDLAGLTVGTAPYGRVYYSAASWNSGSLNLSIRYRRERDL